MASKNIVLKEATYNGVESIELPQSGGGNVLFTEVSDTTATASDVASGKYFYTAAGVKTEGTASGGGGGLEYEEGTWEPSEDVQTVQIDFNNTHTDPPIFVMLSDDSDVNFPGQSYIGCIYACWYTYTGAAPVGVLGFFSRRYASSSGTATGGGTPLSSSNYTNYVNAAWFNPTGGASGYYFRSSRTYKWIAVWAPTT